MLVAAFLVTLIAFGLVSAATERHGIPPTVFVAAAGFVAGTLGIGRNIVVEALDVILIGSIALAAVLFIDATRVRLHSLLSRGSLPLRLLLVALPLTVGFGALIAKLLAPRLTFPEAFIVAIVLAPTVTVELEARSGSVPNRIRDALNVESGLNDGIAVSMLMLFIALARPELADGQNWLGFLLQQEFGGAAVGILVGSGGWLIERARTRHRMDPHYTPVALLALALLAWHGAEMLETNGFIAAFTCGLTARLGHTRASENVLEFTESWGWILTWGVLFLFAAIVAPELSSMGVRVWVYAIASITIARMVPVAFSMIGAGLNRASVLYLGWFGPRGLASIVLGYRYIEMDARLANHRIIIEFVALTVLISIFAHGLSAMPLAERYGAFTRRLDPRAHEHRDVEGA